MRGPRRTLLGFSPFHWGPGAPPDMISSDFQNEHRRAPSHSEACVCWGGGGRNLFCWFWKHYPQRTFRHRANFSLGPDTKAGQEAGGLELDL